LTYIGVGALGGALGILPLAGVASATDDGAGGAADAPLPAPVVADSSTFTLPLFGAPLVLDVSTDPAGALASVAVNPADGYTAVVDRPNRVVFTNEDGTGSVRVYAGRHGEQVKVKGSTLADIVGPGGWSGDVFGTGATTTVSFTVADRGDGTPDIVGLASSDATATISDVRYHSSGWGSSAWAAVSFDNGAQKRTLMVAATVASWGDHTRASVSATLSKARAVPQAAADAAGPHAWDGMLCDGTAAHIDYTVAADGTVSGVSATPAGATISDRGHKTSVKFASGERVVISVREHDGQIKISAATAFRCHTADPSVNTPVDTTAPSGWGHDGRGHDGRGFGDGPGNWKNPWGDRHGDSGRSSQRS
jgi:hypothetical protein